VDYYKKQETLSFIGSCEPLKKVSLTDPISGFPESAKNTQNEAILGFLIYVYFGELAHFSVRICRTPGHYLRPGAARGVLELENPKNTVTDWVLDSNENKIHHKTQCSLIELIDDVQ